MANLEPYSTEFAAKSLVKAIQVILCLDTVPFCLIWNLNTTSAIFLYCSSVSLLSSACIAFIFILPHYNEAIFKNLEFQKRIIGPILLLYIAIMLPLICFLQQTIPDRDIQFELINYIFCVGPVFVTHVSLLCKTLKCLSDEGPNFIGQFGCSRCKNRYSDKCRKRTPIVLKACGHTVCEECAINILDQEEVKNIDERKYVYCPVCGTGTYVRDSVGECLPKNYMLMFILREFEEEKKKMKL